MQRCSSVVEWLIILPVLLSSGQYLHLESLQKLKPLFLGLVPCLLVGAGGGLLWEGTTLVVVLLKKLRMDLCLRGASLLVVVTSGSGSMLFGDSVCVGSANSSPFL